jgi:antitoxin ParD1/3/4
MATMNISLPDSLKEFVEYRVAQGNYSNSSDFVRDVLRRDQMHHEGYIAFLKKEIEAGYASGFVETSTEDVFAKLLSEDKAPKSGT